MRNHDSARRWVGLALWGLVGCSGLADSPDADPTPLERCALDADCPRGLICQAQACVRPEDGLPPEFEAPPPAGQPAVSPGYLFVLAPEARAVLALDAQTLSATRIPLLGRPVAVAALPGRDAAVVLETAPARLTLVEMGDEVRAVGAALARAYARLAVAPDGGWVGLAESPATAGDGVVALVDLTALAAEAPDATAELAVGFRPTDLVFREVAGAAVGFTVVAKDTATHVDLRTPEARPTRLLLPADFAEIVGREVLAPPGEGPLLVSSPVAEALGVLDVETATVTTLPLGGVATDMELSADGRLLVAALRGAREVVVAPLPEALTSSAALARYPVRSVRPGLVTLTPDGQTALVFSRVDGSERLAALDLRTGEERVYDRLAKQVRDVVVGPAGRGAIVVHQADPDSLAADPVERAVDRDEGYALLDLDSGFAQLVRTGTRAPSRVVFGASGDFAAVTVVDPQDDLHRVDVLDFVTLVANQLRLPSRPRHAGLFLGSERVWIAQDYAVGRLGVVDLPTGAQRTLSGLLLDAALARGEAR